MTRSVLPPDYVQRLFQRSRREAHLLSHLYTQNDDLRKQVAALQREVNRLKRRMASEGVRAAS